MEMNPNKILNWAKQKGLGLGNQATGSIKNLAEMIDPDTMSIPERFANLFNRTAPGVNNLTEKGYDMALPQLLEDPLSKGNIGASLGSVGANIKAHPGITAGLGALGGANIYGLLNDDKVVGQLGGLALGTLGQGLFGSALPVPARAAIALGGGTLGGLFDMLRAKKEQGQLQQPQQQMQY